MLHPEREISLLMRWSLMKASSESETCWNRVDSGSRCEGDTGV